VEIASLPAAGQAAKDEGWGVQADLHTHWVNGKKRRKQNGVEKEEKIHSSGRWGKARR